MKHFNFNELVYLMDGLSVTVTYTLMYFKLIILWKNSRIFYEILEAMNQDWNEQIARKSEWAKDIMRETSVTSGKFVKVVILTTFVSVLFYSSSILFNSNNQLADNVTSREKQLLMQMELPFDSSHSPIYEIVIAVQFAHQIAAATVVGVLTSLLLAIILHLGGQIDIIRKRLSTAVSTSDSDQSFFTVINSLIGKHQQIITMAENLENLFTLIALLEFVINTLTICFLGLVIITSISSMENTLIIFKFFGFICVIITEAFIFCFAGEYLTNKSKLIGEAAYKSLWYELKPKESSVLILVILRSQRQLTITIGKIMELSLERFTTILKASVSYISVLYAFY
ncbi:odorant receptor 10-like [Prorops nasuta]|uniref:odorant receptor 10-like n=1 Tax=Prorops nasuta TaxID=863751 RepID=UPI0034CD2158